MKSPMTVLIVDDEAMIRENISTYLEDEGFSTRCAATGLEALQRLRESQIQACLVDVRLSDMDGETFILKANKEQPQLKYLLYTGSIEYQLSHELRQIGLTDDDLLIKTTTDLSTIAEKLLLFPTS